MSPYSPENRIFYFWDTFLIFILSYFTIYLLIRTIFNFPKSTKIRILTLMSYFIFSIFIYLNWNSIYNFHGWFENTFTTEMKVYWGPFDDSWQKPEPDKIEHIGQLKIGTYYQDYSERLNSIFADLDTDDWVLTTIGMFHINSHWESHPVFLYCRESNIERLEKFNREKLNYLLMREISRNTIENIFNGKEKVNSKFLSYIMADSISQDSEELDDIYFKIDSLQNLYQ